MRQIYRKLTLKTQRQRHLFPLLTLIKQMQVGIYIRLVMCYQYYYPVGKYMLKVHNEDAKATILDVTLEYC